METSDAALGHIIGAIGEPDFVARTAAAFCAFTGFDLAALILHRDAHRAELLFDNFDRVDGRSGVETYVRATRRINPMIADGRGPRALRARDFASRAAPPPVGRDVVRAPDEELGYRTVGWPRRQEEIALHVPLGGAVVEIGLYRARRRDAAPAALLDTLAAMGWPVAAAFERHAHFARRPAPARAPLTPREAEVRDLLLRGCSTEAVALRLSLSRHTVKDHRKAIFRKLGIASLAELFSLAHPSPSLGGWDRRPA
ncbi:helix-turn-helix transcriptional regulator [Sphingopyxis panaciterrulae]|uniref:DNA-binding CsgD family transcriptional regulator n=1 Tax=Sphingopyxis panaciterrulae TaxID=462372 RepID=A0A7W9EPW6_9SPHN|nr:helix-turn-helix transcriptional regulator [Sphingopyxis panaciterrulae]MBB5705899.1 DNA-binding CsgD family transcriptional regulator [Sphingopyxis panaciterrulae]